MAWRIRAADRIQFGATGARRLVLAFSPLCLSRERSRLQICLSKIRLAETTRCDTLYS